MTLEFGTRNSAWARLGALCLLVVVLAGCRSYQLQGTVVNGMSEPVRMGKPAIVVVNKDDPRLQAEGLPSASVSVTLDPDSMRPKPVGTAMTDSRGRFSLPIGEGAGFLIYETHIVAQRGDHHTAETIIGLPNANQRLLIVLPPGKDTWKPSVDFVDETMRMSEPYMEGGR